MTEENEQQMEQLFHDHYERMYRLAFALLHDNDEAKDVNRFNITPTLWVYGNSLLK